MFDKPGIKFTVDTPVRVFIAFDWNDSNPLDPSFQETDMEMSLLKIDEKGMKQLMDFGFTDALDQINLAV